MAEQLITLFESEIQKNLFPDNEFYKQSKLDGGIDLEAKTVEVPQSGALPGVVTNPTSFPLTPGQRVDDTKSYDVDYIATLPTHLTEANEAVINYGKRRDILEDHEDVLNTRVAKVMSYAWAPTDTANILKTTGSARPSSVVGGADKKAVTYEDILSLATALNKMEVPKSNRYLLVSPDMYQDLLSIDKFINFDYKDRAVSNGVIGTILGFQVFERNGVALYNDTFVLKGIDDVSAVTDRESMMAWHSSFVRRGEGNVKVFYDEDNPVYLGDIMNAAVRAGGMSSRLDGRGVVTLVQETA